MSSLALVVLVIIVILVAAYYGWLGILEKAGSVVSAELDHQENVHTISIVNRTAELSLELTEENAALAEELEQRLKRVRLARASARNMREKPKSK